MSYAPTVPTQPDDLLECPYDKSHQILRHRIQTHITKCSKNHPGVKKVLCPFDSTHVIDEPRLKHHIDTCDKKSRIVNHVYAINTKPLGEVPHKVSDIPQAPVFFEEVPSEEWEEDSCRTYNPEKYVAQSNIIRNKIGAQPAQRRAFRRSERERLKDLANEN